MRIWKIRLKLLQPYYSLPAHWQISTAFGNFVIACRSPNYPPNKHTEAR